MDTDTNTNTSNNSNTLWDVVYRVPELTGAAVHRRGPYSFEEARYHLSDIAGYDGVTNASITVHAADKT